MADELSDRFAALAADVQDQVRVAQAGTVLVRGDRRRRRLAATSAAALVTVTTLGTVGLTMTGPDGPDPSAGPGSFYAVDHIPAKLTMPHEGEPGWQRNDDPSIPAAFDGCASSDPTQPGRSDARTLTGPGWPVEEEHSPTRVTEQLFLYATEKDAQTAITALSAGVTTCGWIDPQMGQQLSGTNFIGVYPEAEVDRVAGVQLGNALFLVYTETTGALMSSAGTSELETMAATLCTVVRICPPGTTASYEPSVKPADSPSAVEPSDAPATHTPSMTPPSGGSPQSSTEGSPAPS